MGSREALSLTLGSAGALVSRMKLYTFRHSPNPLKARIALAELGLEYEAVEVNLFAGEHRREELTKLNPHQKLPVLVDGALVLPESNAILAHLGLTRGGALWPTEPTGVAQALRWLFFDSFSLGNQCGAVWWADTISKLVGRPAAAEEVLEDAVSDLETALTVLERHLDGRDYLLGNHFMLPDAAVGVAMAMLKGTRLDDTRWPRVRAYRARVMGRPSWERAGGGGIHQLGIGGV